LQPAGFHYCTFVTANDDLLINSKKPCLTSGSTKHKNAERQKHPVLSSGLDTAGLGTGLWLIGDLASLMLFFTPYAGIMGWILLALFTPVTIAVTWWWFRQREPAPSYPASAGDDWKRNDARI
jgi:hypothetical protein